MAFYTKTFYVGATAIDITLGTVKVEGKTYVKGGDYREHPSMNNMDKVEWETDTQRLCTIFSETEMKFCHFRDSLEIICIEHINKFGRLIDNDLFFYVDEILLIMKSLTGITGEEFAMDEARHYWRTWLYYICNTYKTHVWINIYPLNPYEEGKLVRYEDL